MSDNLVSKITIKEIGLNKYSILNSNALDKDIYLACEIFDKDQKDSDKRDNELLVSIKAEDSLFIGNTNKEFQKVDFGLNIFNSRDCYIGYFEKDLMNHKGIYINNKKANYSEIYIGDWKDNKKINKGLILWVSYSIDGVDQNSIDFYYGDIDENQNYTDGVYGNYLKFIKNQKEVKQLMVYKGKFIENEGKILKDDPQCLFYSTLDYRLFAGKVEKEILKEGNVVIFKEDSGLKEIYKCDFTSNNKIIHYNKNENSSEILDEFLFFKEHCEMLVSDKDANGNTQEIEIDLLIKFAKDIKNHEKISTNHEYIENLNHLLALVCFPDNKLKYLNEMIKK